MTAKEPVGNNNVEMRTYLEVPYEDKDEAKILGARWDKSERQWYIPPEVPTEKFGEFGRWFPKEMWYRAPLCPKEEDPVIWGQTLYEQLKAWAEAWKVGPASLKYWDIESGTPPLETWKDTHQVVQVVWPRGPYCWAISLLNGRSFEDWRPTRNGFRYFLQPNHHWSFAVDSIKL